MVAEPTGQEDEPQAFQFEDDEDDDQPARSIFSLV